MFKHMIDEMFCFKQWSLEHMSNWCCVEREALEHMSIYICVACKALEHMKIYLEVLGISPIAFHVDVEHKLWNIRFLAIVSLGVSYKYIKALVFSEEL